MFLKKTLQLVELIEDDRKTSTDFDFLQPEAKNFYNRIDKLVISYVQNSNIILCIVNCKRWNQHANSNFVEINTSETF